MQLSTIASVSGSVTGVTLTGLIYEVSELDRNEKLTPKLVAK